MKKKRIIAICFTFMMLYTVSSAVLAASYRMTWQGWSIIGKRSNQTMALGSSTTVTVTNNITNASGVPNKCNATLSLQKQGWLGTWSTSKTLSQTSMGTKTWTVTLASGTYSVWFNSNKINGKTNPLDMKENIK